MMHLAFSVLLVISGVEAIAAPQGNDNPPAAIAPKTGKPGGAGGAKSGGGGSKGTGSMGGMGGLFGTLKEAGPLLNMVLGQPASPPSGCAKLEVLIG